MTDISTASTPAVSATTWTEIDLSAVRHNVFVLARMVQPASVAAVVKADAYGHGAVTVSRAALEAGAALLCVFTVAEAAALREAGIDAPILVLGPLLQGDMARAAALNIEVVVDSAERAERLSRAARERGVRVRVHINVDSGMQRYGRPRREVLALAEAVRSSEALELEGVFTHLADVTNPNPEATLLALRQFVQLAEQMGARQRHAAASAAAFRFPESRLSFVRAGIALYGVDPAPATGDTGAASLRPVLSWRATLLSVRDVAQGETVSYGGLWTAPHDSRIGVLGVGYADGLRRALSPGGSVLLRGRRAPIRGAICMDSTMVDLSEIPGTAVGDIATLIGDDGGESIRAWEPARWLNTIPYEIFTSIAARVPRIPVEPHVERDAAASVGQSLVDNPDAS